MKVSFHGHSVVKVDTGKHRIIIDPFINGNKACDLDPGTEKADVILLTHGHNDHVGETVEIAKNNNALVVATAELADYFASKGLNTHPMHIGGPVNLSLVKCNLHKPFMDHPIQKRTAQLFMAACPVEYFLQ